MDLGHAIRLLYNWVGPQDKGKGVTLFCKLPMVGYIYPFGNIMGNNATVIISTLSVPLIMVSVELDREKTISCYLLIVHWLTCACNVL